MITPGYGVTATERVLPRLALDFTTASLDPRVTIARAGNTATVFNSSGVITLVNANLPRFDYSPTAPYVCRGLLIEETRTNLFLNSLIDGTNLTTQSVTLTAAAHTLSFYGSGSVVISGGHSATVTGTGNFPNRQTYTFTPTAGSSTFTVSGDVKYAQIELGSFPSSFIPTAGAAVQRNADDVTMTGTNFSSWFSSSEGTFEIEYIQPYNYTGNRYIFACSGAAIAEQLSFLTDPTPKTFWYCAAGGSTVASLGPAVTTLGARTVQTGAYKLNNYASATNGSSTAVDTSAAIPTGIDRAFFGTYVLGGLRWSGWVSKFYYWPQRLVNAEIQAFSK